MVGKILVEVGKEVLKEAGKAVVTYAGMRVVDEALKDDTGKKNKYRHGNNHHQKNFGKKSYSRNGKH